MGEDEQQHQEQQADAPPAIEIWNDFDPSMRFVSVFPMRPEQDARSTTVVYTIIEPGRHTGLHADNFEELLYVFDGEGEAFVSGRQVPLEAGTFHVMPAGLQHDVYAYGDRELRYLSFFPSALAESTFQEVILPSGGYTLSTKPFEPVIRELTLDELPPDFPFDALSGGQVGEDPPA